VDEVSFAHVARAPVLQRPLLRRSYINASTATGEIPSLLVGSFSLRLVRVVDWIHRIIPTCAATMPS